MSASTLTMRWVTGAFLALFMSFSLYIPEAEAKRFGGGGSFGRIAPAYKAPAKPASPTRESTATSGNKTTGTAAPAATPKRSFMGPLGGLAAGLGLAALFSYLGFGEEMASVLGTMLMLGVGFLVIRWLFRMMAGQGSGARPSYQGAGQSPNDQAANYRMQFEQPKPTVPGGGQNQPVEPSDSYSDAIASQSNLKQLPAGFDEAKFVESAKSFFVMIQKHFDSGDLQTLSQYCTQEVLAHAEQELADRNGQENVTSVVTLEADLIGFETDVDEDIATVAFDALLREEREGIAHPVHELWVLTRPSNGSGGWMLAGVQNV